VTTPTPPPCRGSPKANGSRYSPSCGCEGSSMQRMKGSTLKAMVSSLILPGDRGWLVLSKLAGTDCVWKMWGVTGLPIPGWERSTICKVCCAANDDAFLRARNIWLFGACSLDHPCAVTGGAQFRAYQSKP
jgi:hypothetical protein